MHKKFGRLLQPGGHVELNETPWDAISHELVEETGYEMGQLEVVQPGFLVTGLRSTGMVLHPTPFVYNTHPTDAEGTHFHTDAGFLFLTTVLPVGVPGVGESTDLRWVTLRELREDVEGLLGSGVKVIGEVAFQILADSSWLAYPTSGFK